MIVENLSLIPSPPQGVWYLGPIPIRAYALCIITGIIAAVWLSRRRYVAAKVAYWQAVEAGDQETLASADEESRRRSADLRQAIHTMSKRKDNEDSNI